jgi:1,4-dihydroxy-2-naphthoate octaprenyltransferase
MKINPTISLLRIPFSFFLSPLYFFALAQVPAIHWGKAALIFFILHFLIYPASNGYNSYMDRDTESIGGLEKPPAVPRQLFPVTIVLDVAGLVLSCWISPWFAIGMVLYIGASKAYSYRGIRLKKYPFIGYVTVVIFQGAATFWLVYHGSQQPASLIVPWQGMVICALLIGGFYPLTQIYQHRQDKADGVETISYRLGYRGTFIFCSIVYLLAFVLMAIWFLQKGAGRGLLLVAVSFIPIVIYFIEWFLQVWKNSNAANFKNTMKMNWLAAICTNLAFIGLLIIKELN